jgi:DNA-directed RNA polymerase omega subunit
MIEPKIDDLLARVDSKYTLVILAARRARQINGYYSQSTPAPTARPSRSPSRSWSRTS